MSNWTPPDMNTAERCGFRWGARHPHGDIRPTAKAYMHKVGTLAEKLAAEKDFTRDAACAQIALKVVAHA